MVKRLIDADLLEFCLETKLISYNKRETEYVDGLFCGLLLAKQIVAEQKPVNMSVTNRISFTCPECGGDMGIEIYGQNYVYECGKCGFRPSYCHSANRTKEAGK